MQTRFELEENQMKRYKWEQDQIAHMKVIIAKIPYFDLISAHALIKPRKKICMVQVTGPTFLPPTLNFFLQILKSEENSRAKLNSFVVLLFLAVPWVCLTHYSEFGERIHILIKIPSESEIKISMHSVLAHSCCCTAGSW